MASHYLTENGPQAWCSAGGHWIPHSQLAEDKIGRKTCPAHLKQVKLKAYSNYTRHVEKLRGQRKKK